MTPDLSIIQCLLFNTHPPLHCSYLRIINTPISNLLRFAGRTLTKISTSSLPSPVLVQRGQWRLSILPTALLAAQPLASHPHHNPSTNPPPDKQFPHKALYQTQVGREGWQQNQDICEISLTWTTFGSLKPAHGSRFPSSQLKAKPPGHFDLRVTLLARGRKQNLLFSLERKS